MNINITLYVTPPRSPFSPNKDATEITLWERITKSNHEDVTYYKGLLQEYTRDLLMVMREDFLEEITGKHIKNKAFEEDSNLK